MSELVFTVNELKRKLLKLIVAHDELLFHTYSELDNKYIENVGIIKLQLRQRDLENKKTGRLIQLIQEKKRNDEEFELEQLQLQISEEFEKHSEDVNRQVNNIAYMKKPLIGRDRIGFLNLYAEIIDKLHPCLNSHHFEQQNRLHASAMLYFKKRDATGLKVIKRQLSRVVASESGDYNRLCERRKDLLTAVRHYQRKIDNLCGNYPFTQQNLLNNEEKLDKVKKEMLRQLDALNETGEYLEARLKSVLALSSMVI